MLKDIQLRWKEWRNDRVYEPEIKKLKAQGKADKAAELGSEYLYFRAEILEERRLLYQSWLIRKAMRLYIPTPPYSQNNRESWEESSVLHGHLLLTENAIKELRREIREELKASHETAFRWLAPVSGITGIIGATIGLVSVLWR